MSSRDRDYHSGKLFERDRSRSYDRDRSSRKNNRHEVGGGGNKTREPQGDDWVCGDPKCNNLNFSRRSTCNKCGTDKTDRNMKLTGTTLGKQAADKSKGLFAADDWQCSKCGNVNWSRRMNCNVCNHQKFGEEEMRTGYGGGYKENDNIEYKEHESDSEYDDFGRKKKSYRGKNVPETDVKQNLTTAHIPKTKDNGLHDEEEVSEEECDLSKYELSESDDEDNS